MFSPALIFFRSFIFVSSMIAKDLPRISRDVSGTDGVDVLSISLIKTTERPRRRLSQVFAFDFLPRVRKHRDQSWRRRFLTATSNAGIK